MSRNKSLAAGILGVALATLAYTAPANAAFVATVPGNDCAGVYGSNFGSCAYNGSPIIIKFEAGGGTEINSPLFPTITGLEFVFLPALNSATGTWIYTPGEDDPIITAYVAKGGPNFNVFTADAPLADGTQTGVWYTPTNPNNNQLYGLSHLSFYDTESPPTDVPEPVSLALLGSGILGLGFLRRRKNA